MTTCSAEEIARKKRNAMEKLQGRKGSLIANINQLSAENIAGSSLPRSTSTVRKISTSTSSSFYPTSLKPKGPENKASTFLSAVSNNKHVVERLQQYKSNVMARKDAVHPYHKSTYNKPRLGGVPEASAQTAEKSRVFLGSTTNCHAYLISANRFEVETSNFHQQLVNVFKTLTTKNYDPNNKRWNFDLSEYTLLQERLLSLQPHVIMAPIPSIVLDLCKTVCREKTTELSSAPTIALSDRLMPFQEEGVRFAIAQNGRAMICDEMGLGKTYQALAIADYYRNDWPVLICTTASTRDSWYRHVKDLLSSRLKENQVYLLNSNQEEINCNDVKVLISSYNMMERNQNDLKRYKFGVLIFDESHSLKNSKAKCTMGATRLAQNAKRVILISGTPALSKPVELFSQLKMIDRNFMDFLEYTTRYCNGKQTNFGWDANGQSNLQELNVILKLKFMIRRTKVEVLNDLSNKKRETVILDPLLISSNGKIKASLDSVAKHFQESNGVDRERVLLNYYAETAVAKVEAVCAYLEDLINDSKKFIVFGHHHTMLNEISNCMNRLNVNYIRIDGKTKNQDRGLLVERFQTDKNCRVAILSLGACNSGITLTSTNLIIFAELTWNPSTLAQAEARAHRIGQKKDVICRYLIASNTADDYIWKMLQNKQEVLKKAGIFCENLQDSTHHNHETNSEKEPQSKIDKFFSSTNETKSNKIVENNIEFDLSKEIDGVAEAFHEDSTDDDVFKDILL